MVTATTAQRFSTPMAYSTVGAHDVLQRTGTDPMGLIKRHYAGEWNGQPDNAARNEEYLTEGYGMLMSIFDVAGTRVWVISHIGTGDDYTTLLLPSEY